MSLFHEEWRQEAYYSRSNLHLRDLPQNHLLRVKQVPFSFHEYRVHTSLPCLPYERTAIQCFNNYGVKGAMQVPECVQMVSYFKECVQLNKYFATLKKLLPESFAENQYSRDKPNLEDIGY